MCLSARAARTARRDPRPAEGDLRVLRTVLAAARSAGVVAAADCPGGLPVELSYVLRAARESGDARRAAGASEAAGDRRGVSLCASAHGPHGPAVWLPTRQPSRHRRDQRPAAAAAALL